MMDHCNPVVHKNDKAMFSESLQEQLYLDNVLKEFFHLQLLEQQEQQTSIDYQLCSRLDEIHVLTPHSDVLERNKSLEAELCQCRSELEATIKENAELQNLLHNLKEENDFHVHEKETLLGDLSDCKAAVASLEQDVTDLNMNIRSATEERDKMEGLEKRLNEEIRRLSAELVIFQDEKSVHNQQQSQLNADLKETMSRIEQLVEENAILQSKLEIHKAKLAEVAGQVVDPSSQVGTRSKRDNNTVDIDSSVSISATDQTETSVSLSGPTSDDFFESNGLIQLRSDLHDSASAVAGMKGYLEEAQKMLQSLEKAMDEMHAPKATAAAAGISKLIQSFESKSLADGHGSEEAPSSGSLYTSSKVQFGQLRVVLETLTQNNAHASALIMKEKDIYDGAITAHEELEAEIESLKGFNNKLELRNIELEVLWGAMKQYLHNIEAKKAQLFDALQGQKVQLNELRGIVGEVASVVSIEVETLEREMKAGIHAVERRWKSSVAELALMVEKLDAIAASAGSNPHHIENSYNLDVFDHFSLSLNYACEVIEQLKTRLEVAGKDHETLSNSYMEMKGKFHGLNEEHNLAIVLLQKFFKNLVHFLHVSGNDVGIDHIQIIESNPLEPLDPSYYEALLEKSDCFLDDFVKLKESKDKLYSDLLNRTNEIEELKKKIVDSDVLLKIIMDVKDVMKLQDTVIDLDEVPVVQLQSFVLLLIERYKEVEERANKLSNNFNCGMIEYDELQGHVEWLEFFNFQQQNEVLVLRESLTQAKDALDATYVELLDKTKAFEQSEQRIASIREKLSIAVAKGKGLVVQRDSLKHSLSEMSTELEKSLQELRLKESKLHEVEERLKSYSEAGERMEALESELSYIRNSATALRESFLMKDNTLLKIEEILEDLELPEQFHTKDITEKVDWLAKAVAGNSLPPADWDQRSSVGGGSYSDAGFLTDGCKEDTQSTSNPDDDLKRKCDELQTKLYEMAEQNEMLEQSLMDRNILVQRWEEILDRIHTPPQIRSMEPVERIHWLGTAVSEADNHMRSLQKEVESLENYCRSLEGDLEESQRIMSKHESSFHILLLEKESALTEAEDSLKSLKEKCIDLENYCESLSADLEESRRKITQLESLLRDAIHDKETFGNDVVSLSSDRDRVLDTVAQYEQEVDRLGKEVNSFKNLKEKHIDLENYCESLSTDLEESRRKITQLDSLLRDAIHDKETFAKDVVSLSSDRDRVLDTVAQYEQEVDRLGKEVDSLKTLKEKHIDLENYCESLSTDLAESQRKITELESLLRGAIHDKETFANDVVSLSFDRDRVLDTVTQYEGEVDRLGKEVDSLKTLKEKHIDLENYCESLSTDVAESRRKVTELQSLLRDAVRDKETFANDVVSLSSERDRVLDTVAQYEGEVDRLGKEIDSLKTLKEKHIDLEIYCESLSTDLAESRRKITELESLLRDAVRDKETFANDVVSLSSERDRVLDTVAQYKGEVDRLGKEVDSLKTLKEKHFDLENYCESLSTDLAESRRKVTELESLLRDSIRDKETFANDVVSLSSERDRVLDTVAQYEGEVDRLGKEVDSLKTLKEKHFDLENYCESLSTDLAESRRKITELESLLGDSIRDKETFANDVVSLSSERDRVLDTVAQYEREVDRLGKEVDTLQKQKLKNEDQIQWIESEMKRLQHLILDVLPISDADNVLSYENNIQDLEMLMRRLIIHIKDIDAESCEPNKAVQEQPLLLVKDVETHHSSDKPDSDINDHISRSPVSELPDVADVSKQLSSSLDEIKNLREERDVYMQNNQSLASEVEILKRKVMEVEELLKHEEQKSASLREKLNLAVRKGKSLVQQRDSLKQNIEEMTTEIDQFKSKINNQEHALLETSQKISDLSLLLEHYKAFETENMSLKSRLMEAEPRLEQTSHTLNALLSKLSEIDAGDEINTHDPLQKLDRIGTLCSDLNAKAASFQQEASKSKKAAELLLAELNEVQERNDDLQEEIARAYDEVSNISKERDLAESAKAEALSHLAKLSEERKEFEKLKSNVHEVKKGFFEISALIGDLFAKNKEHLQNLSSHVESCLEHSGVELAGTKDSDGLVSMNSRFKDFWSRNLLWDDKLPNHLGENVGLDICMDVVLHFQQLAEAIGGVRDTVHSYSMSLDKETEVLTTMISTVLKSIISRKDSFESMKGLCTSLKSTVEEKDMEVSVLRKSICFLYDACLGSITEIERRKFQLVGETSTGRDLRVNLPADGVTFSGAALSSSENCVTTLAEELLLAVKDYVNIVTETVEGCSNEMRSTLFNLQKELQEKDIQREQICMELVSQIKEAETSASNYARELQSMKSYAQELESKLETMGKKQTLLEQQVEELLHGHSSSMELEEKVNSLHGVVAAKDQEIEVLMQALDEEENQMETLRSRVDELQKLVEKKSIDLERVEASRAKAVKKLAVTVSKFDELHHMSEGLLSEVENLQDQLQDRDAQISFLRKEVTRCTNDVLETTKKMKERNSGELIEFLKWLNAVLSNVGMRDAHVRFDGAIHDHDEFKEHMQKDIVAIMSELGDLRVVAQSKDALLQAERSKVEDLSRRKEELEVSLREMELHVKSLHGSGDIEMESSEIVEVEPVLNKWSVPVNTSGSQVRSLRKVNNDQVSIAIDTDADNSGRFEDDEDDKVHGFKSLTTSRFVPKFTRPVSDMIDGLWVSCDRALMRQPAFRLGIMIYWAVLHALLASLVV